MRHILILFAGIAATVLSTTFAGATMRITSDRGGRIIDYAERFLQARASGEQVVIDGACLSACTLVVGMLPRDQVCVTPKAVLGFHAAWRPTANGGKTASQAATQVMMEVYPPELRSWIGRRGGLTSRLILLEGRDRADLRDRNERRQRHHPRSSRAQIRSVSRHLRCATSAMTRPPAAASDMEKLNIRYPHPCSHSRRCSASCASERLKIWPVGKPHWRRPERQSRSHRVDG
jgi:hypothetical protein